MDSTIGAAVIGALVALLSLVISKEHKVSEFRQAWIDSLRQEISESISKLIVLHSLLIDKSEGREVKMADVMPVIEVVNISLNSAYMRLNKKNPDSAALAEAIEDIEQYFDREVADAAELKPLIDALRPRAKIVLKNAWERVKKGEKIYRLCLYVAGATAILIVLYILIGELMSPWVEQAVRDVAVL